MSPTPVEQEDDVLAPLPNDLAPLAKSGKGDTARATKPSAQGSATAANSGPSSHINGNGTSTSQSSSPLVPATHVFVERARNASPRPIYAGSPSELLLLLESGGVQVTTLGPSASHEHVAVRSPPVSRLPLVSARRTALATKLGLVSRSLSVKKTAGAGSGAYSAAGGLSPSVSSLNLSQAAPAVQKPRFKMFEDGSHEHNLRAAKRQEKLSNMLKDLLGAKKLRDGAKLAVPNILQNSEPENQPVGEKPPTLFAGLVSQVKNNTSPYHHTGGDLLDPTSKQDLRSFVEKYGRCHEVIGRGSFGVVRISHKKAEMSGHTEEVLYAVKEFKRRVNESEKKYLRRLTSEFCISSSLKHQNIIDTLDLLKDAKGDYCEVMEFCPGGDLYTLIIAAGKLEYAEADCLFKQLIRGVNYMHDMGVAHRDLKPENCLLTQQGVLKLTDFGNSECFKMAWESEIHLSEGVCGSSPYIAPEEFISAEFDPRCVDIWSCGVIYMAMRTGRQLWKLADPTKDEFFEEYLVQRKDASGYEPIESLKRARCRNVVYLILDPIPERRITGKQILSSEWGREIKVCAAGEGH